jgi:hypothetical protein
VQRFLSFAFGASLVVLLAMPALADSMPGMSAQGMKQTCPVGQAWIKGYKTKKGAWVKGYCRKKAVVKTSPSPQK